MSLSSGAETVNPNCSITAFFASQTVAEFGTLTTTVSPSVSCLTHIVRNGTSPTDSKSTPATRTFLLEPTCSVSEKGVNEFLVRLSSFMSVEFAESPIFSHAASLILTILADEGMLTVIVRPVTICFNFTFKRSDSSDGCFWATSPGKEPVDSPSGFSSGEDAVASPLCTDTPWASESMTPAKFSAHARTTLCGFMDSDFPSRSSTPSASHGGSHDASVPPVIMSSSIKASMRVASSKSSMAAMSRAAASHPEEVNPAARSWSLESESAAPVTVEGVARGATPIIFTPISKNLRLGPTTSASPNGKNMLGEYCRTKRICSRTSKSSHRIAMASFTCLMVPSFGTFTQTRALSATALTSTSTSGGVCPPEFALRSA
mmetsp:Transcript_94510/g.177902  ORF Transcript_94510/g.177902 Transcript_94510/m.177902 type:complete len:375 (-) Transcript_94510:407-1531(-)